MEKPAKIHLSLHDGRIEIDGSEEFVERQIEKFADLIRQLSVGATTAPPNGSKGTANPAATPAAGANGQGIDAYPKLFAIADDRVQITKSVSGANKADKTVKIAMLVVLGNSLRNVEAVPLDVIRDVCKVHGTLDESNFSTTMKDQRELFVLEGTPRSRTAKLTVDGKLKAAALAAELNGAE